MRRLARAGFAVCASRISCTWSPGRVLIRSPKVRDGTVVEPSCSMRAGIQQVMPISRLVAESRRRPSSVAISTLASTGRVLRGETARETSAQSAGEIFLQDGYFHGRALFVGKIFKSISLLATDPKGFRQTFQVERTSCSSYNQRDAERKQDHQQLQPEQRGEDVDHHHPGRCAAHGLAHLLSLAQLAQGQRGAFGRFASASSRSAAEIQRARR